MIVHTLKMCTGDAGPEQSLVLFMLMHNLEINGKLVDVRTTCIHLLKIASVSNFSLLFGKNY